MSELVVIIPHIHHSHGSSDAKDLIALGIVLLITGLILIAASIIRRIYYKKQGWLSSEAKWSWDCNGLSIIGSVFICVTLLVSALTILTVFFRSLL